MSTAGFIHHHPEVMRLHQQGLSSQQIADVIGQTTDMGPRFDIATRVRQFLRAKGLRLPVKVPRASVQPPVKVVDQLDRINGDAYRLYCFFLGLPEYLRDARYEKNGMILRVSNERGADKARSLLTTLEATRWGLVQVRGGLPAWAGLAWHFNRAAAVSIGGGFASAHRLLVRLRADVAGIRGISKRNMTMLLCNLDAAVDLSLELQRAIADATDVTGIAPFRGAGEAWPKPELAAGDAAHSAAAR